MKKSTVLMRHKLTDVLLRYSALGTIDAGVWVSTGVMLNCMDFQGDEEAKHKASSELGNMCMDGLIERKSVQGQNYWKLTIDGVISELESYFES